MKMKNGFKFKRGLKFDTGIWIGPKDGGEAPILMNCNHMLPAGMAALGGIMILGGVTLMVTSAFISGGYEFDRANMQLLADLGYIDA